MIRVSDLTTGASIREMKLNDSSRSSKWLNDEVKIIGIVRRIVKLDSILTASARGTDSAS